MADRPTAGRQKAGNWQVAAGWMVVLAVALAILGTVVAFQQMESLTNLLLMQAQGRAADLANDIKRQINRELEHSIGDVSVEFVLANPQQSVPDDWPSWLSGIYVFEGSGLIAAARPPDATPRLEKKISASLGALVDSLVPDSPAARWHVLHDELDGEPVVLVYRKDETSRGPCWVVGYLDLSRLRRDLVEANLAPFDGLAVADAGSEYEPWFQPLQGPARYWVLVPSPGLLGELRRTVVLQTLTYLFLTFFALVALLGSVWFLSRVTRRELALAELKANFVADVSHELKTPLAVIRLYGETLQSGRITSGEKQLEYYATITREAERLTNLINTILDFARIESGRKEFFMRPTDVVQVVREGYNAFIPELDRNGFLHRLSYESGLPPVEADPDAIRRVLFNLMSNAVKYSDDEKRLDIELTRDTRRGKRGVLISVHDRGIGISPEDRAHVFDGFYRASDRRVREKAGTGLGLSLVKQIVEAHGGSIDIESRLVKGTTIRVFLPAQESKEAADPDVSSNVRAD
jgi:signal transduction histidine kinase